MDVRALWVQQERHNGLRINECSGEENPSDLGTKAHPVARFLKLRKMCGIVDCSAIDNYSEATVSVIVGE